MKYKEALEHARRMRKNPTKAEEFMWEKVRSKKIGGYKLYRQYIIEHADILGVKGFFIVDFYCHQNKLIVELDGSIHSDQEQQKYDKEREQVLEEMGFMILRFRNEDVLKSWDGVERIILAALENSPRPS